MTDGTGGAAPSEEVCYEALSKVVDPELGLDIVSLGLVYGLVLDGSSVTVEMTMTSPGCPMADQILFAANNELLKVSGIENARVNLVWAPLWTPEMMSLEAKMALGYA